MAALPAKPPLKGEVPATGGRRGSLPNATKVTAALSAAVTTTKQQETAPQLTAAYWKGAVKSICTKPNRGAYPQSAFG